MKVEVNEITIRHNGTAYEKGQSLSLSAAEYERIKDHVTVLDDADDPVAEKPVERMSLPELKAHAKANSIDLGEATKKEDILAVIVAATSAE